MDPLTRSRSGPHASTPPRAGGVRHALRRLLGGRARRVSVRYEPVLGTDLELRFRAPSPDVADAAERAALAEIDRLERVFSRFDPHSELNRWIAAREAEVSPDLAALLADALRWMGATHGAFHPGTLALTELWTDAARRGVPPREAELRPAVAALRSPPFALDAAGGRARMRAPGGLDLNAIAKGRIVDRAAEAARAAGAEDVLLSIGGDLRHLGDRSATVAVAEPGRAAENARASAVLRLRGEAVATSGGGYRDLVIAGRRYPHVFDPRTGYPVEAVTAATVLAPDCATADVLATAFTVLPTVESLALADTLPGVGCHLTAPDGTVHVSPTFADRRVR